MNYPGAGPPERCRPGGAAPRYHRELFVSDPEGLEIKPFVLVRYSGPRSRVKKVKKIIKIP